MNEKEEKGTLKLNWEDIIQKILVDEGGSACLRKIYEKAAEKYPEKCKGNFESSIRGTIYAHSSDSNYYNYANPDMFESINNGEWAIRKG